MGRLRLITWLGSLLFILHPCCSSLVLAAEVVTVCQPLERESAAYDFFGKIVPVEVVEVHAPVAGVLGKTHFKPNADVKKGALLFEIDAPSLKNELKKAEATVKRGQESLQKLQDTLDKARKNPGAKAEDLEKLAAEREVAAASLELARTDLKQIETDLERTRVTAPLGGRIDKSLVSTGDRVEAGPRSATLLGTITRTDPVRVAFNVHERALLQFQHQVRQGKIKAEKPAHVQVQLGLDGEKGFPHPGAIDSHDNRIDPKRGHGRIVATFANADGTLTNELFAPEKKKQDARVRLTLGAPRKVLLVPASATGADAAGNHYVLIVNEKNVVESRTVKLGARQDSLQVIENGLQSTDWLILGKGRVKQDATDKRLSPEDFVPDLRQLGIKPGMTVAPARVNLNKDEKRRMNK